MKTLLVSGDVRQVLERVACLRPDSPRQWGRMSVHQMICHLTDSFLVAFGEKQVSSATGWYQRSIMKWGALYLPAPWPKDIATRPEIDQVAGAGTPPANFELDKETLRAATMRFVQFREFAAHPFFGEMKTGEWMRWGYLHMDHHLRQFGA
jgi:Protein of unknown function (DUF1569)